MWNHKLGPQTTRVLLTVSAGLILKSSFAGATFLNHTSGAVPFDALSPEHEEPHHEPIDRKVLDRVRNKILDLRRTARRRRGLAEEEDADEKYGRLSRLHQRRDARNLQRGRCHLQRQQSSSRRKMQTGFAEGIIITGLSPGINPKTDEQDNEFYVAGIKDVLDTIGPDPANPGQKLVLRNLFDLVFLNPDEPNLEPLEIFWDVNILDNTGVGEAEAFLAGLPDWYMERAKYKKGKLVYIDLMDDRDPEQLWDFRPGPALNSDQPLSRFQDRTWRPTLQLGKRELCVAPVLANGTKTVKEFDTMELQLCTNNVYKRPPQVWVYCFEGFICNGDDVVPPNFRITVACDQGNVSTAFDCDADIVKGVLNNGRAVNRRVWNDLDDCANDPIDKKAFGKSFAYRIDNNNSTDWLELNLRYGVGGGGCDLDDADAYLRVYEENSDGWDCVFVGKTNCTGGNSTFGARIEPHTDDFLVVVSSDGRPGKNEIDFELSLACNSSRPGNLTNLGLGPRVANSNLYCFADVRHNVREGDVLPPNRTACTFEEEDIVFDQQLNLQSAWEIVDTRGITGRVTVRSECNEIARKIGLETLIRIYRIEESVGGNVTKYDCEESVILDCFGDDLEVSYNLVGGRKYLIVGTGGTEVENCELQEFDCR